MPFFASIVKDQKEQTLTMSRKFNLNLNDHENLFRQTPEALKEIKEGKRANIEWTPIKVNADVRWNSYEAKNSGKESQLEISQRNSSILIRNIEMTEKKMSGKPSNIFDSTPNRYT